MIIAHSPTLMTRAMMSIREGNEKDAMIFYQVSFDVTNFERRKYESRS